MYFTNVLVEGDLGCKVDLKQLTLLTSNIRYSPKSFSGAIWQHKAIGGNCLVFPNGKINCNGKCSTFEEGHRRLRKYARLVQKLGWSVCLKNVKLVTASAAHELSRRIKSIPQNFDYEPEIFPALMNKRKKIHFTCHFSGKVLITGIRRLKDLDCTSPASFSGLEKFYRAVRKEGKYVLGRAKIRKWLEKQEPFTLHRQINRKFRKRKVIVPYTDYQWDADTANMINYNRSNDGYAHFLLVIDIFSRYVWTVALKSLKGKEMVDALKSLFDVGRLPEHLETDSV
ncbi:hypothetical protein KUTeg_014623 [Tegillarca granosa]|uniref:Integrase catalytic domain-containing protein n=1 Tax=Tegillarca granosa TaxID=220873 RepID=A0ABQ9EVT4_TEGGR|nr:hypothetical protein KUTeg_014623 [Tegillarca granosa]